MRFDDGIFIHQQDYCLHIIKKFGFTGTRTVKVPFDDKVVLKPRDDTCLESLQPPEVTLIYHLPFGLILRFPSRIFEFSLRVEV